MEENTNIGMEEQERKRRKREREEGRREIASGGMRGKVGEREKEGEKRRRSFREISTETAKLP